MPGVVYPRGGAASGSKTPTVPNRMKESWLVSFQMRQISGESPAHYRSQLGSEKALDQRDVPLPTAVDLAAGRDGKLSSLSSQPTGCARAERPEMEICIPCSARFLNRTPVFDSIRSVLLCQYKYLARYRYM